MAQSTWEVAEPGKLLFDQPVTELNVRVVNGTVNVVGTDEDSARLEVSRLEGPPLVVTREGSSLTVAYADLHWTGWLKWLDRKGWQRDVVVSLAVPAEAAVRIGVVGAGAVISGIRGTTSVHSVSGDATLVRLTGSVRAETVSGSLEAQSVTGALRYESVSGDLTVIEGGAGSPVRAESVSGDMLIDLAETDGADPPGPTDVRLATVSGELAIRLPDRTDADVEVNTTSGPVSNAFGDLRVTGRWGAKKITGTLGAGTGTLRASTMSGSIALLRRPSDEDGPAGGDDPAAGDDPAGGADPAAGGPGDSDGPASTATGGPTGKVL
ncbi:hypothetical protein [Streptomyces sp. CAU 1734]|uniref:DUF4097 family beta strand repeat-containing protein n=1 Tax=Streptomyces sp. CAU 1734 TaxID=3140360 RepID=UPI0032617275